MLPSRGSQANGGRVSPVMKQVERRARRNRDVRFVISSGGGF